MTDDLLSILDLEPLENNLYRGKSFDPGWQRVYGGQVIGQALMAASRTVEDRLVHSLHGYFLRPGHPAAPIVYDVERIRDGGSFSTRRVVAIQHGQPIFSMAASFHREERGFEHQMTMPAVPMPEELPGEDVFVRELIARAPGLAHGFWGKPRPIEIKPVDLDAFMGRQGGKERQGGGASHSVWMRLRVPIGDDEVLARCVLAYASDLTLLDTTLLAHDRWAFEPDLQVTSLDHAMWFHRRFRFDDWLLYAMDSPSAQGARGFNRGMLYDRQGRLVASTAQEGLVRAIKARGA